MKCLRRAFFCGLSQKALKSRDTLLCLSGCIYRYVTKLTTLGSRLVREMELCTISVTVYVTENLP